MKPLFVSCCDFADVVLPSVLWTFPSVLPWPGGTTFWWKQGELVLPPLQVLPCVWQKKQTIQGTVWLFGTLPFHLLACNHWTASLPQPLLECERCQNCYHTSCLGPSYPKQNKKRKAWVAYQFLLMKTGSLMLIGKPLVGFFLNCWFSVQVCTACIRCKSCGITPGKSWELEWNHDKGLCPDCSKLYDLGKEQLWIYVWSEFFSYYRQPAYIDMTHFLWIHLFLLGNYCPICFKCYEDNDYDSQMMQCGTCNHWVHAKCEDLTGECFSQPCCVPVSKRTSLICQNQVKYLSCFKQGW